MDCIGAENKDGISDLRFKIQLLEKELEHVKSNMVSITSLHELQMEIGEIRSSITEMQNNRSEDRESIGKLNHAVEDLSSRFEEYIENGAKLLIGQERAKDKNNEIEKIILQMNEQIKDMNLAIERANIVNQIKYFYQGSQFNKWILRLSVVIFVIFMVAVFVFFFNGGETTFFDILNGIKELIL